MARSGHWGRRRPQAIVVAIGALVCAASVVACGGGEPDPEGLPRVDSTDRFAGERRQVAATIEAFERAVLTGDIETICARLLRVRESRDPDNDNGGRRFCMADPANDPVREVKRAGGEERYDLVVRSVELERRRGAGGRAVRHAIACVTVGGRPQTVELDQRGGRWEVIARSFDRSRPALAPREFALGCRSHALISVFTSAPRKSWTPREAVIKGPFANWIRRATSRGASLSLAGVTYRPDYRHAYLLRGPGGRPLRVFPVTVFELRSLDASTAELCRRRDAQRLARGTRSGLSSLLRIGIGPSGS